MVKGAKLTFTNDRRATALRHRIAITELTSELVVSCPKQSLPKWILTDCFQPLSDIRTKHQSQCYADRILLSQLISSSQTSNKNRSYIIQSTIISNQLHFSTPSIERTTLLDDSRIFCAGDWCAIFKVTANEYSRSPYMETMFKLSTRLYVSGSFQQSS